MPFSAELVKDLIEQPVADPREFLIQLPTALSTAVNIVQPLMGPFPLK